MDGMVKRKRPTGNRVPAQKQSNVDANKCKVVEEAKPDKVAAEEVVDDREFLELDRAEVSNNTIEVVDGRLVPGSDRKGEKKKRSIGKTILVVIVVLIILVVGAVVAGCTWYKGALKAPDIGCVTEGASDGKDVVCKVTDFEVKEGQSTNGIAESLKKAGYIRDENAFLLYLKLSGNSGKLKAGFHSVSSGYSVSEIVDVLMGDPNVKVFRVTFLPGGTLEQAKKTLIGYGYSEEEIDAAFDKNYEHLVLQDKPEYMDLEGYIYGETYEFYEGATVEEIIKRCLDELWKVVQSEGLVDKFAGQGFNLYEGITLASIVQREGGNDLPGVARVFLNRLNIGMNLGSDVTYQYICDKLGVPRDYNIDNEYNTRKYPGLTPGPISAPGKAALIATANPADNDYYYFLSGDDDITYYARNEYEHNQNIINHCQEKCQII